MAIVEIDDVVGLIHTWLKENHLLKTVRALESEYGKVIQNKENGAGLQSIITCYRALTGALLSTINYNGSPKGKPDPSPKAKPRKQQNKNFSIAVPAKKETDANNLKVKPGAPKTRENSNKNNVPAAKVDLNKTDNTIDTQQGENSVKKRTQKRKYSPLVPPGEWVCPEMKTALENLYNKMNLSTITEEFSFNGQHPGSVEKAESIPQETVYDPTQDTAENSQHKKKEKKKKRKHENDEENIENGSIVIEDDTTLLKDCDDLHLENEASFSQKKEKKKKKKQKENNEENIENGSIVIEDDTTLLKDCDDLHMENEASFSPKKEKKKKKKQKEKDRDSIQNNSITELGDESLLQSHEGMSEDEFIAFKKKKKKKKKSKEIVEEEEEPVMKKRKKK